MAWRLFRRLFCRCTLLLAPALLAACAGHPTTSARRDAAHYAAEAQRSYPVPGPPGDPWGPYITEASQRFDVPDVWVRSVMHVESGGHEFLDGRPITSSAGAMGLMQVMPTTYENMRARYGLGEDPFDPHNNILAGTAYLHEMYDLYGTPAFLAAYNAGPRRLDDYLAGRSTLPDETRRYVAMISPNIAGTWPNHRSPAEQLAYNRIPEALPPGRRSGSSRLVAWAPPANPPPTAPTTRGYSLLAANTPPPPLPVPPAPPRPSHSLLAPSFAATGQGSGFHLISAAEAAPLAERAGASAAGEWAIQVGAFSDPEQARQAAHAARIAAHLTAGQPRVGTVHQARLMLYRARLTGLSRASAIDACERLSRANARCLVLSPNAQL